MATTDEVIATARAKGLRVYNLGELASGGWVANLIDGARRSATGYGSTPSEAVTACVEEFAAPPVEQLDIFG